MDKKDILEAFKNYSPNKSSNEKQQETTENEEEEEDSKEESLEENYRDTCIQAYKSTGDPVWLFKGLMEGEDGGIVFIPEFQIEIINFYEKYKKDFNLNIEACVDHGKTHLITCLSAHEKIQDLKHTTLYSSEKESTAKNRVEKIKNYLKKYSELAEVEIKFDTDNTGSFNIEGNTKVDPSAEAKNFLARYTGAHVNQFVMDDVETHDTISIIDDILQAYQVKANNRLSATGKMIAINTPYASYGLLTRLRKEAEWITLQIGLPQELLDEEKLNKIIEELEKQDTFVFEKVLSFLKRKWIFQSIDIVSALSIDENEKQDLIEKIRSTLDFRYRMRIIMHDEIINEKILPEWEWKVKTSGRKILASYLTSNQSYQLTFALNTEGGEGGGYFTYHQDADIEPQELAKLINEEEPIKTFSYDLSSPKRAGTIILEELVFQEEDIIIKVTWTDRSLYAVEENIKLFKNDIHVVERNSWQETIIKYMSNKEFDQQTSDNIIYHYSGSNKEDFRDGIVSMNGKFYNRKKRFLKGGEGIELLKQKLTSYTGIKTKSEQWDEIDALWFIDYNIETIRGMKKRKISSSSTIKQKRFAHIKKIF